MASVEILAYLSHDEQKVRSCIKALLACTPNTCAITFISERMPLALAQYISQFSCKSEYSNISFTNFTTYFGYNNRMLKVLQSNKSPYVILINDNIIVNKGWVSKLLACLNSESCIGITCPFINEGIRHGICNALPNDSAIQSIAKFLDNKSKREYPRITSADACLLIKKAVLDKINFGTFRVQSHLEPELCHEARRFGFNVAIADDLFVFYDNPHRAQLMGDEKYYRINPLAKFRQVVARQLTQTEEKKIVVPSNKLGKSIKIYSPSDRDQLHGKWWGDYWAREHLHEAFGKRGWDISQDKADVSLLLRGSECFLSESPTKAIWIYSHPHASEHKKFLEEFNYVYTLSHKHARILEQIRPDVKVLLPATAKTYKKSDSLEKPYDIVIVGNSAKSRRVAIVKKLIATNKYKIGVVGSFWENHIDQKYIIASYWENDKYSELFNQATLTIYTHADDMRDMDFVAIRVLDIIACSDCMIICDKNEGLEALGLGDIPQFANFEELESLADYYLSHPEERKEKMGRWRRLIQRHHTFDCRVEQITNDIFGKSQPATPTSYSCPNKSVAVYLSTMHRLCYDMNIKFANGIVEAFKELGFDSYLVHDVQTLESRYFDIVFCAAPSFQQDFKHRPDTKYIMYQSEQCPREDITCDRANRFWQIVSKELPKYDVIFEPFEDHIEYFRRLGYNNVVQFRVGYHPTFELNYPETNQYDVMYIGHPAGELLRRCFILERLEGYLKANKIPHFIPAINRWKSVLGEDYNKMLFSSKISLNIHFTHIRYFEYHKLIVDSFCNKRFVLSEEISHLAPFVPGQHIAICNANEFEDQISYYLKSDAERQRIAQNAYNFVKQEFTLAGNLKKALEECGLL